MRDVVSMRIYVVNYTREAGATISEWLLPYFPPDGLPTTTWTAVQALVHLELIIELEAVAVSED